MTELRRKLNLYGLTMIAVGSCIGSGIFVTPYKVVEAVPNHSLVLIVWLLGGVIALTGALTFAELGGMFPNSGGVYVYLKEAYGKLAGFLYGWVILLVINTGALAALGITFAEYFSFFVPLDQTAKVVTAILVIAGLTAINITGVENSQIFANIFTGLKLLAIAGIILIGFLYYDPDKVQFDWAISQEQGSTIWQGLLVALIGVLWSFGGWHHASYLAGEAQNAQKTVPRAMVLGALIVTITYVLVNLGYMLLLPLETIAATTTVAGDAVSAAPGMDGRWVAIAIGLSVFGTIGIYTTSAPRIYYAMAKDGLFFTQLAKVHDRFQTPAIAMIVQAVWSILLLFFWGTFYNLISYVTFMDIAFMAMAGASVFVLRKKRPEAERPYRAWGYPFIPLIFVVISAAFVVNTLFAQPEQALAGLLLLGVGIGAYYGMFRQ